MKKWLVLMLILALALALLAGCGSGDGSNNGSSPNSSGSEGSGAPSASDGAEGSGAAADTSAPAVTPIKKDVEVPAQPLNISDESIYFVEIDGVRYDLYTVKVSDFLKSGFVFKSSSYDENTKVDAHSSFDAGEGAALYKANSKDQINVYPINLTGSSIPLKDCEIVSIWIRSDYLKDTEVYMACNLSIGSTEDEVFSVFGADYDDTGYGVVYRNERTIENTKSLDFTFNEGAVSTFQFWLDKNNP